MYSLADLETSTWLDYKTWFGFGFLDELSICIEMTSHRECIWCGLFFSYKQLTFYEPHDATVNERYSVIVSLASECTYSASSDRIDSMHLFDWDGFLWMNVENVWKNKMRRKCLFQCVSVVSRAAEVRHLPFTLSCRVEEADGVNQERPNFLCKHYELWIFCEARPWLLFFFFFLQIYTCKSILNKCFDVFPHSFSSSPLLFPLSQSHLM